MKKLLRKIFLELNPKHDLDYVSSLEPLQFREIEEIQAVEAPLVFRKMARGAVIGGLIGGFTSAATGSDLAYSVLIGAHNPAQHSRRTQSRQDHRRARHRFRASAHYSCYALFPWQS